MATMLNDTMGSAKSVIDSAMNGASHAAGTAKHALENAKDSAEDLAGKAKDGTEHAVASARSTFMDGIHAFTSAVTMIRNLGVADALGWVGLERRRSPLISMGIFSAGFAAGAGAGVLFAPMSGLALRRKILKALLGAEAEVEAEVKAVAGKAEDLAGKAKDAVIKAEQTVEHAVTDALGSAKHGVESAAAAVKDGAKDAASAVKDAAKHATNGADTAGKQDKDKQGTTTSQHR